MQVKAEGRCRGMWSGGVGNGQISDRWILCSYARDPGCGWGYLDDQMSLIEIWAGRRASPARPSKRGSSTRPTGVFRISPARHAHRNSRREEAGDPDDYSGRGPSYWPFTGLEWDDGEALSTGYLTFIWGLWFSICLAPPNLQPEHDPIFAGGPRPERIAYRRCNGRPGFLPPRQLLHLGHRVVGGLRMVAGPVGWPPSGQCRLGARPDVLLTAGSGRHQTGGVSRRATGPVFVQWADLHHSGSQHRGSPLPAPVCPSVGSWFSYLVRSDAGMYPRREPSTGGVRLRLAQQATGTPSASDIQRYLLAQSPVHPMPSDNTRARRHHRCHATGRQHDLDNRSVRPDTPTTR